MTYPAHAVFLDPDYRKEPDTSNPWCWRCQKAIKDTTKAIRVNVIDAMVWPDENGGALLGRDCARIIKLSKVEANNEVV